MHQLSYGIYQWPESYLQILMMMLSRLSAIAKRTNVLKYAFSMAEWQQIPKPWNLHKTKQQRKLLKNPILNPLPNFAMRLNDTLHIPGLEGEALFDIYESFIETKQNPLSSQFVSYLLYNFSKAGYLNKSTWVKLEPYIGRNRGEYSMRSIFGGLYGCIRYGSEEYMQFFIDELAGQKVSFSDMEAIQIIEAFNLSQHNFDTDFKHQFWEKHFKQYFMGLITENVRIHNLKVAFRIFDAFNKFEYFQDEQLWNVMLGWMERRKGWKRTEIIERLYPLTGTFEKAKQIFDVYYAQLSTNPHVTWRYNLEEMRLYTSEQMIKKSQIDIKMNPSDRTLVKRIDQKKFNDEYHQWLKDGARQKEAELVKDKAQSLAYAIKDRYESMKKDKVDFSKLSLEEFEDLFGVYDPNLMYQAPKAESDENEEGQQPAAEAQEAQQEANTGKKGKKK